MTVRLTPAVSLATKYRESNFHTKRIIPGPNSKEIL